MRIKSRSRFAGDFDYQKEPRFTLSSHVSVTSKSKELRSTSLDHGTSPVFIGNAAPSQLFAKRSSKMHN